MKLAFRVLFFRFLKVWVVVTWMMLVFSPISFLPAKGQADEQLVYRQDFEGDQFPEWTLENGWQIVDYEGNRVLEGRGHVFANLSEGPWTDLRLKFKILFSSGSLVHVNIRNVRITNRYFWGISIDGINLSKQTGPDSFINDLVVGPGTGAGWHEIEVAAQGSEISISVDGKTKLSYIDPNPYLSGYISFESHVFQPLFIDDIEIWAPMREPTPTLDPAQKWVYLGGPLGGMGYDVRMDPDNPDRMYVTDAYAGFFTSRDGGMSWLPSNTGITTRAGNTGDGIPVFCASLDPNNPAILWAGTSGERGVFYSENNGKTWERRDNGIEEIGVTMRGFGVDPSNSDIVYAAGEISSWEWNQGQPLSGREFDLTMGVVYKTIDRGLHWQAVWRGENLARYVWINPHNPNIVYISTGIFDREAANSEPKAGIPGGEGILKSIDGGQTWKQVNAGLKNWYAGSLFMHPENPDILVAGTGNVQYSDESGVYITTDGAATWQKTLSAFAIAAVEISTSNPQIVYAANSDLVFRSEDGGWNWRQVTPSDDVWGPPGITGGIPIDIQVDPRDPKRLFINSYGGGNFVSSDGGSTWAAASQGYTGAMVRDIVVDPGDPARVIAASRSGIFASTDGGITWEGLGPNDLWTLDWHAISIHPTNSQEMLSELTCDKTIMKTTDGGHTWAKVASRPGRESWKTFTYAPSNPQVVYAGTAAFFSCGSFDMAQNAHGVFRSTDGGDTWQPANDENSQYATVNDLAVDPTNERLVYAATQNYGLLMSTNGGEAWSAIYPGVKATSVRVHPTDPSILFLGTEYAGVFTSREGGQNWTPVVEGIQPGGITTDIVFDPSNPQVLYLSDLSSGVYRSMNGGKTWFILNSGLLNRSVNKLAVSTDGNHLYAAIEGMGVYRMDLNGQPPRMKPSPAPTLTASPSVAGDRDLVSTQDNSGQSLTPSPSSVITGTPIQQNNSPGGSICGGAFFLAGFAGIALMISLKQNATIYS